MTDRSSNSNSPRRTAAIILAAGRSTRMKTDRPKVLHEICGRPMLSFVLDACRNAGINEHYVIVGYGKDQVMEAFRSSSDVRFVEQAEQKGTGHAVSMCSEALSTFDGDVIVIAGDMPMLRSDTLRDLIGGHRAAAAAASLATTTLHDPTGYGRIVRDKKGAFEKIVEHRDCNESQLAICEVNPSYYCFDARTLFAALPRLKSNNAKGEYYITDVLELVLRDGGTVRASVSVPAEDAVGINSREDLAEVGRVMQQRIQRHWMAEGVTIVAPETTWIESGVRIGAETVIRPFSYLEGSARIGSGCQIGPYAYVEDGAVIADGQSIGPGMMSALDATAPDRSNGPRALKGDGRAVRRPPAQSGCA